eukprot:TRINITY_DN108953_c0_g1_i1.p1 TRINITY_DN108953_c0_g1~~TRINITY_DN108953_c0_g1_i1.p1  ORF type:complete len:422 (+),score=95.79 TRINITY_DN108953_c0_g1_i1:58-1323(+)
MKRFYRLAVGTATIVMLAHAEGPDLDLVLYGADGCVGHFAASHLAKQPDLKWAIAGRNKDHLKHLADELALEGGNSSKPEIIVASLDAKSDLKSWVSRAKAVITAAGPFSVHGGEYLVKACAETGVHYSDTSDEFYWQRRMMDFYGDLAEKSGSRMVLSSGFCALAGDLGSQLALAKLGAAAEKVEVSVDAWLETYNGGLSAGVINTAKALKNATYPKEWDTDPYVLAPEAKKSLRADSKVEGMSYPNYVSGEGVIVENIFGPYDARLLRKSFTRRGQKVKLRVGATAGMYPRWTAFLARHPGSWTKLSKCPDKAVYEGGSWAYRFKASFEEKSSSLLLSGNGDPGYHFTAWGLAETGLCLAGKTKGCLREAGPPEWQDEGGIYTSMSTLNAQVMRSRLESIGLLKVEETDETEDNLSLVV